MKNKIKGLLALVLSVLIGQAWAADPVATWTNFGNLTSGEYSITKDAACRVNDDGSIMLGGAGLSVAMPANVENITVVMDVSTLPALDSYTIINLPVTSSSNVSLMYKEGKLEQEWGSSGDYGDATWTPGSGRYTIAFAYNKSEGTCTYVDGVHKVFNSGLKTSSTSFKSFTIGSYKTGDDLFPATGMTVHSIRLYDDMFMRANNVGNEIVGSDDEECPITIVGAVTVNAGQTLQTSGYLNFTGSNVINEGGTLEVVSGEVTFNANGSVNGTVNISEGATFVATNQIFGPSGAVTGAGKLVCNGWLPPDTAGLTNDVWTGTVKIDNMASEDALKNLDLTKYGNANSTIELGNLGSDNTDKLYFPKATIEILSDIVISGTVNIRNGYAEQEYSFKGSISGAGTLKFPNTARSFSTWKIYGDMSGFTGTIDCPARTMSTAVGKIIFCSDNTVTTTFDNGITVADGYALTVNATYPQTMKVLGTIKQGTGSLVALTFANGATIDATDGALVVNGDVTIADGSTVNVTLPTAATAGTTVLTCNNADAVKAQLVAPEGLRYVAEDGAVKLAAIPVAQIGETPYETLQAACEAANEGDIVQLIADTEENCVVKEGFNGTIDLGGNTLTGRIFSKSATMTIQNGTIIRKRIGADTSSSNGAIEIQDGSLTLQDTLSVQILANDVTHLIRLRNSASCVINGGNYSITSTGTDATMLYPSAAGTTMIVNGGTFTYDTTNTSMPSIANIYGTLTINGGTFNAYGQSYLFNIDNVGGKTYVKNGLFNCSSSGRLTYNNPKPGDPYGYLEFSGGKYACNPETTRAVIAEGYASGLLEDNYYIVSKAYAVGLTVDTAKATVDGLNEVHACGSIVSFTVAAVEGFKVTSVKLGTEELTAVDGNYTFKMPAEAVTITITTEAASTFDVMINGQPVADADALKLAANSTTTMTVPETSTWTAEGNILKKDGEAYVEFADYYTVVVNGTTVTLKLNKPVIGDSAEGADDAFTVTAEEVTIKITNYNSALKYGVRTAADINGLSGAEITPVTPTAGVITLEKSGDSAFYEVVVSDVDFPVAE